MVHVGQWSRRRVHQAGPNPMDRAAYFSNKDEIMAFSQSIADQLIAMGARTPQEAIKQLSSLRLYLDIKRNVDSRTLKRYHKYIYLYLEEELYTDLYEQVQPAHKVTRREDGTIARERWHRNGKLHREDGPAWIEYRSDGTIEREVWCWHGEDTKATSPQEFEAWTYLKSVGLV
jgi:hypothetical protein